MGYSLSEFEEKLDDLIDEWHDSGPDERRSLHDFLGMTWEEYSRWTESAIIPQSYLDRHPEMM